MSATSHQTAPQPGDVRARTPLSRWLAAVVLGAAAASSYGILVTAAGRLLFLDPTTEAALRTRLDGGSVSLILWLAALAGSTPAAIYSTRETLDAFPGRPVGDGTTNRGARTWAWPVIFTGAPVLSMALAAGFAALARVFRTGTDGSTPVLFATTAGFAWLVLVVAGRLLLEVRTGAEGERAAASVDGIERTWFQQASSRAFWDVACVAGLSAVVLTVLDDPGPPSLVASGIALFALADFSVRVWVCRRREERG